eukprot:CAMPEP_0206220812 /NCGR_PEP_ID=MMETSP0047_2-20121206/5077_1 /ASSEMBLY_ACC=CAM_ASM_000192 /TAXON_ID=195065 /ORGANISM="Chroomonas mesostigmatica_cf, Strain CCMP1168" /LENGTH=118 /DNA_ID=CAMNT_0053643497 /DNA_START=722 /DNA_END=1078 /DNA_ORIENTATION=-
MPLTSRSTLGSPPIDKLFFLPSSFFPGAMGCSVGAASGDTERSFSLGSGDDARSNEPAGDEFVLFKCAFIIPCEAGTRKMSLFFSGDASLLNAPELMPSKEALVCAAWWSFDGALRTV